MGGGGAGAAESIYKRLATDDVRDACDLLMPVHEASDGCEGFVSLEVSPHLAYDPGATLHQARELWDRVRRPNLFIKIPGTPQGLHAVETLLVDGIKVNITLLFGRDAYSIKPLDVATLQRAAEETGTLLVIEDHHRDGGLGDAVAAQVGRLGRVFRLGVSGEPRSGSPEALMERHRISGQQIEREALAIAA